MTTITAPEEQSVVDEVPKQLYIGGEWRDGAKGTFAVEDPATGESLCEVADARSDDAMAALDAAVQAGPEWAAIRRASAARSCAAAFETIIEREDELALLMTLEMGKPLKESQGRGRLRRRVPALVLRGGGADRRPLRGRAQRPGPAADDAAAGRARAC